MANKHVKICSTSLNIWKIQFKITVKYHHTIRKSRRKKKILILTTPSASEDAESNWNSYMLQRENVKWQLVWKRV